MKKHPIFTIGSKSTGHKCYRLIARIRGESGKPSNMCQAEVATCDGGISQYTHAPAVTSTAATMTQNRQAMVRAADSACLSSR
jgi:hypothetical protein